MKPAIADRFEYYFEIEVPTTEEVVPGYAISKWTRAKTKIEFEQFGELNEAMKKRGKDELTFTLVFNTNQRS